MEAISYLFSFFHLLIRQEAFFALMQQNEKQKMHIRSVIDALSWCFIMRMMGNAVLSHNPVTSKQKNKQTKN